MVVEIIEFQYHPEEDFFSESDFDEMENWIKENSTHLSPGEYKNHSFGFPIVFVVQ